MGAIITRRLTTVFAERGWSIVSGLALGCDAIAHQTALDCQGHTVAVLAHGLHTVAPRQHVSLAAQILDAGGQLVSAYPFGQDPIPAYFAERDAVQAGMARAVVMIQSDLEGGSLHASRAALRYGRILAVPAATQRDLNNHEPKSGANRILTDGAEREKMTLLDCAAAQLEHLIVLRSKDDYAQLLTRIESAPG
jgi:DNA processing protein